MNRKRWIILGSVVGVLAIVAFLAFRPDKLFVDNTVDEELDDDVVAAIAAGSGGDPGEDGTSESSDTETTTSATPGAEPTPTEAPAPTTTLPEVLGEGNFVSQGGHTVNGSAFVVNQDGGRLLVLPELDSENGPDLQLYLSPESSGSVDGGVKLGPLKGNIGTQSYELPDDIDLSAQTNVVIWCERFATPFGTATLG
ncbi:MAG: DM13 domain-containing protein [Microthrixaceae bacterium]